MKKRSTRVLFGSLFILLVICLTACGKTLPKETVNVCTVTEGDYTLTVTQQDSTVEIIAESEKMLTARQVFTVQADAALTAEDVHVDWTAGDNTKVGDLHVANVTITQNGTVLFEEAINMNKPATK